MKVYKQVIDRRATEQVKLHNNQFGFMSFWFHDLVFRFQTGAGEHIERKQYKILHLCGSIKFFIKYQERLFLWEKGLTEKMM